MASLWEIFDPTILKYDTTLGRTNPDSGQGPPTAIGALGGGWIRTGFLIAGSHTPGIGNCRLWNDPAATDEGTIAILNADWDFPATNISPWQATIALCTDVKSVWCVEDQ